MIHFSASGLTPMILSRRAVYEALGAINSFPRAVFRTLLCLGRYTESKQMATTSANYISSNGATHSTNLTSSLKTNPSSTIRNVFTSVANENSNTRT